MNNANWKKSFRKIPARIMQKLSRMSDHKVVVACVRKVPASVLADGTYAHLGMSIKGDTPSFPERVTPDPTSGRFSMRNVEGHEIVRKDRPMITNTYSREAPNWGDWGNGSHEVCWNRDVYERDFIPPKETDIGIQLLAREPDEDPVLLFRFSVEEVLDRRDTDFETELFSNLNLLQENVGGADVFAADTDDREYLKTISVFWEILPPGARTENLAHILSKFRTPNTELRTRLLERYSLLEQLNPIAYISGTSGFQRYFGAQFADDLVVFENIQYGNALYVMFDDWEDLSKRSRLDLLRHQKRAHFERIVHRSGWQDAVTNAVSVHRRGGR